MSKIKVDEIVNEVGDAGPQFPNGVVGGFTVDGSLLDDGVDSLTVDGSVKVNGSLGIEEIIEKVTPQTTTTGTIDFDFLTQAIENYTVDQTADRTINFRGDADTALNDVMVVDQSMTCSVTMAQGSTAYYLSAYQIDGYAVTPKWSGGSAPTGGNASGVDVYTFTIIKTADATFTVLASQSQYA